MSMVSLSEQSCISLRSERDAILLDIGDTINDDEYGFPADWYLYDICADQNSIWLGTTDGCYVTQWDLVEYKGDCELLYKRSVP